MILITTPDYLPKLGGLTTFTVNLTKVLDEAKISYEVFAWNSITEIKNFPESRFKEFSQVINIHYYFGYIWKSRPVKMINILHGSEITFSSPIWWKKIAKSFVKLRLLRYLEMSYLNIFISEFTSELLKNSHYRTHAGRDVILHNGIDTRGARFVLKNIQEGPLVFVCIARDVKHKNIKGAVKFCEYARQALHREVELILPQGVPYQSDIIKITKLESRDEVTKNMAYHRAHLNLLLSISDYGEGFVEGFGLTILEASLYGTPSIVMNDGGLVESVHDSFTGWIIDQIELPEVTELLQNDVIPHYAKVARQSFEHTLSSHSLFEWGRLFRSLKDQSANHKS